MPINKMPPTKTSNDLIESISPSTDAMNKEALITSVDLLEKVASVGAVLVAIGVLIEAVIGIALIVKHHRLRKIQEGEELALYARIEETRERASLSEKKAAEANERAKQLDLSRVELEKRVEELRQKNLELEADII